MTEYVVQALSLGPDGVEVGYLVLPDDVRAEGQVVLSRSLAIAYTSPAGLGEQAVDLRTAVEALARSAHEQLTQLPAYEPPKTEEVRYVAPSDDDDDDEDVGMGDGR